MWQLICHHTYKYEGCAIDLSPFHNDGIPIDKDYLKDGQSPGSGCLRFESQTARVIVKADARWTGLGAVKVEAVARVDAGKNAVRIVALGDESFAFGIDADGYLYAALFGATQRCRSDAAAAPDGRAHVVRTGRWTSLGMEYDGIGMLTLTIDGRQVGRAISPVALHNVTGRGLAIGNAHDHAGGGPLLGEIDEIQVWRYHPNSVPDQFYGRPIDDTTAECWENLEISIQQALSRDPDCAQELRLAIQGAVQRALRKAVVMAPPVRKQLLKLLQRYLDLWQTGDIAGSKMRTVVRKLANLFRANGIDFTADQQFGAFTQSTCLRDILAGLSGIDFDPQFIGLLGLIGVAEGLTLPSAAPKGF